MQFQSTEMIWSVRSPLLTYFTMLENHGKPTLKRVYQQELTHNFRHIVFAKRRTNNSWSNESKGFVSLSTSPWTCWGLQTHWGATWLCQRRPVLRHLCVVTTWQLDGTEPEKHSFAHDFRGFWDTNIIGPKWSEFLIGTFQWLWQVGYNDGGSLTEAVRRRPYSLVLFDEAFVFFGKIGDGTFFWKKWPVFRVFDVAWLQQIHHPNDLMLHLSRRRTWF